MAYEGFIKKSRSLDLQLVNQFIDTSLPIFLLYSPEQLGLTVGVYFFIRLALNGLGVYIRYKTTTPVGEK